MITFTLQELVLSILYATREKAKDVSKQLDGILRLALIPQTLDADNWLGGLSKFEKYANVGFGCTKIQSTDIMAYEFAFATKEGHDGGYGYPSDMAKTHTLRVQAKTDEDTFDDFLTLTVCVFGSGDSEYDTACAKAAIKEVKKYFGGETFATIPVI